MSQLVVTSTPPFPILNASNVTHSSSMMCPATALAQQVLQNTTSPHPSFSILDFFLQTNQLAKRYVSWLMNTQDDGLILCCIKQILGATLFSPPAFIVVTYWERYQEALEDYRG